jgi:hypothetical protein
VEDPVIGREGGLILVLANKGGIEEKQLSEFVCNNYRHGNYYETNHELK